MPLSCLWMEWKPGDVRGDRGGAEQGKRTERSGVIEGVSRRGGGTLRPSRGSTHLMAGSKPAVAMTPVKRRLCSRNPGLHLMTTSQPQLEKHGPLTQGQPIQGPAMAR